MIIIKNSNPKYLLKHNELGIEICKVSNINSKNTNDKSIDISIKDKINSLLQK